MQSPQPPSSPLQFSDLNVGEFHPQQKGVRINSRLAPPLQQNLAPLSRQQFNLAPSQTFSPNNFQKNLGVAHNVFNARVGNFVSPPSTYKTNRLERLDSARNTNSDAHFLVSF